jgi:predicted PurR-regulated permease PerM
MGCIISTFPIGFVALTEYGFMKLALVILMVFGVHAVEAYGLNPIIYSTHLRLHPLLVLAVLVIAEHSLGVWGLLLAVPLTVFTLDYIIRYSRRTHHALLNEYIVTSKLCLLAPFCFDVSRKLGFQPSY